MLTILTETCKINIEYVDKKLPQYHQLKKKGNNMGFRFRKSFNLGSGFRLNLNKKSAGISFGGKGFRYSINTNGRRTASAGIPGTGLYYTTSSNSGSKKRNTKLSKNSSGKDPEMKICKRCGEPNVKNAKFCTKCGFEFKGISNTAVILWLIFFFPVGLVLMWARTNWNKKVKAIITLVIAILALVSFAATQSDTTETATKAGITGISVSKESLNFDLEDSSTLYNGMNLHADASCSGDFKPSVSDFDFVVSDPNVISVEPNDMLLGNSIYFDVKPLKAGSATVVVKANNGEISSKPLKITVTGEQQTEISTKEETTEEKTTKETETTEHKTTKSTTNSQKIEFIVNTQTGVFHYPSCRHVKAMKEGNKKTIKSESIEKMEQQGYKPCGTCIK